MIGLPIFHSCFTRRKEIAHQTSNHNLSIIGNNINSIPWIGIYHYIYVYIYIHIIILITCFLKWMLFLDLLLRRDFRHLALSFNKSKSETNSTISKQQCSPSEAKTLRPYTGKYLFQKEHCFRFWHIFPSYPQAFSSLWPLFRLLAPKHESTILPDLGSENCSTPKYSKTAIPMFMIWKPKKKSTNWDTSYGLMAISSVKIPVFDDFSTPRWRRWVGTPGSPKKTQHLLRVEEIFLRHAHAECRDLASDKLLNDHSDDTH